MAQIGVAGRWDSYRAGSGLFENRRLTLLISALCSYCGAMLALFAMCVRLSVQVKPWK